MKRALKDYAAGPGDDEDEMPVLRNKQELFVLLDEAIAQGLVFCDGHEVDLRGALGRGDVFEKLGQFNAFTDALLATDELRKSFNVYETPSPPSTRPASAGQGAGGIRLPVPAWNHGRHRRAIGRGQGGIAACCPTRRKRGGG
ncbi:MAG: hypothetical protein WC073_14815 [Sterolibacterium sp.]